MHLSLAREEREATDRERGVVDPDRPIDVDADGDPINRMTLGIEPAVLDGLPFLDTEPAGLVRDPRQDDLDRE